MAEVQYSSKRGDDVMSYTLHLLPRQLGNTDYDPSSRSGSSFREAREMRSASSDKNMGDNQIFDKVIVFPLKLR
jgi:hypothetical protein